MDEEVERDDDPRHRGAAVELGVAEDGRRGVVEDVEELEGLLLDDEEGRVEELPVCEGRKARACARGRGRGERGREGWGGRGSARSALFGRVFTKTHT